jgi:hypothetical protein
MTAIVFLFLPSLYAVIERLQYALTWFGVLIAVDLWVGRNSGFLWSIVVCLDPGMAILAILM